MNIGTTARETVGYAREQEITFLAAGIAYYAFVSILPALLLALAIASFVGGDAFANHVVGTVQTLLSPKAQDIVQNSLSSASGRGSATVVGSLVLVWSTLRVFRGLDEAFSRVYGVNVAEPFTETLTDAGLVLAVIAVGVAGVAVINILLPSMAWLPFERTLTSIALLFVLVPVFLPLYYFFPDTDVTVREILPGTIFATLGWTALQAVFSIYVDSAAQFSAYGVLGGALLLVTWLYLGGIVLLFGAVINAVLAGRHFRKTKGVAGTRERQQEVKGEDMTDDTEQSAPDILDLRDDVERLQSEFEEFEHDVDERTVQKSKLESELKGYVRRRMRRGHARGWGPYLVLLYGTAMTLGAFWWLKSWWAILAMFIIWLSTLGLYTLMMLVGFGVNAAMVPGRVGGRIQDWRS
ncbi:YhjD/YihY/BrkB family envelope integrity protein [Haladaptatus sp. AB643]|uniref:YihY/virulence factor BrkB family protein n=1 Tax=unclassified Haladaptatus TaxID=2622732 RepID=UPI00209BBE11|nr:YihY/virulence factor BrkB family protein [Haladaptatus sp. AB643]MCO8252580.1 YihY/virulence factor BrkB family protein [Haladaptatus sp. AB618]